jgi:hypothetical protein
VEQILDEAVKIKTVKWIYFEGGESFLHYPIMLAGVLGAREKGLKTGIVTKAFWVTTLSTTTMPATIRPKRPWLQPASWVWPLMPFASIRRPHASAMQHPASRANRSLPAGFGFEVERPIN